MGWGGRHLGPVSGTHPSACRRESAIELHVPGMCCAETRNCVWQLRMRKRLCKRCVMCG